MSEVKQFFQKYEDLLKNELTNFIKVYNEVSGNAIDISTYSHKDVVVMIGRYIMNSYDQKEWLNTVITLDNGFIDFSVFKGTRYEKRVGSFLKQLHEAFNSNDINKELEEYFESSRCNFNAVDTYTCMTFYELLNDVNKYSIRDLYSEEKSEGDKSQLIEAVSKFDFFVKEISKDSRKVSVLEDFDKIMKSIILNKKHINIQF